MLKITDAERAYFDEMRCLTTDSEGREVLVGLTSEETNTYLALSGNLAAEASDPDGRNTYLALHDKHERARLEVLGAEHIVRTENPPRH